MKESWHTKVFWEYKAEIKKAAIVALVSSFVFGLVYYFLGKSYESGTI